MMENVFVILNGQESYVLFQLVLKTAMDMGPAKITISVCVKQDTEEELAKNDLYLMEKCLRMMKFSVTRVFTENSVKTNFAIFPAEKENALMEHVNAIMAGLV